MRIPLLGGAYQGRSVIAGAQRCVNLYPERNPEESQLPVPITHYPTPGLRLLATAPTPSAMRGLHLATNGTLFGVVGNAVYRISSDYVFSRIGSLASTTMPVSMSDNGLAMVIVDGSMNGYAYNMASGSFGLISGAAFYGADKVLCSDTYFIFNRPGTNQFYLSKSNASYTMLTAGTAFDPLDIAAKTALPDRIQSIATVNGEIWLVGERSTEIWYNTGAADFAYGRLPGGALMHGANAKYSIAVQDRSAFWLSQDAEGFNVIVKTDGTDVKRISTHAIEAEIQAYDVTSDAIGYCYQQQGHAFYVLTFPTQNVSWAYELATGQWHQPAYCDINGGLNRHRANCCVAAYGKNVVGDWQNGRLFALDPNVYTDDGQPIIRTRSFPHLIQDADRVTYDQFTIDMQVGTIPGEISSKDAMVSLRWSDTRGASWGNPVMQSLGSTGEYYTNVSWSRLGQARDRVFEISWSAPVKTALNGAFMDVRKHRS